MSRFFVDAAAVSGEFIGISAAGDIKHISKVLRMKPGDELEISDSDSFEYTAVIEDISADRVLCRIIDKQRFLREPSTQVTLYQGIPKQGKMEVIVQKCVELGIRRIVPVFFARTVVVDRGGFGKKIDRWQKVSAEAVKQCRRGIIPEVSDALKFKEMAAEISEGYDLVIMLYENETGTTIRDVLTAFKLTSGGDYPGTGKKIAVVIGPEGGFSDEEAEQMIVSGAHSASLGKTILRTETAGAAALAMVMYEMEL